MLITLRDQRCLLVKSESDLKDLTSILSGSRLLPSLGGSIAEREVSVLGGRRGAEVVEAKGKVERLVIVSAFV